MNLYKFVSHLLKCCQNYFYWHFLLTTRESSLNVLPIIHHSLWLKVEVKLFRPKHIEKSLLVINFRFFRLSLSALASCRSESLRVPAVLSLVWGSESTKNPSGSQLRSIWWKCFMEATSKWASKPSPKKADASPTQLRDAQSLPSSAHATTSVVKPEIFGVPTCD